MKKLLLAALAVCLAAPVANALTVCYDWEDCGTVLALYPTDYMRAYNVVAGQVMETEPPAPVPHGGLRELLLIDAHPSGTPQAYVAWIKGCVAGDVIVGSFWRYDTTPGGSPSARIWAHYGNDFDVMSYYSSASGQSDYGPGLGWDMATYTWTFTPTVPEATALIIEVRTYSNPGDYVWIDDMCIEITPEHGQIIVVPAAGPSAVEGTTWGGIKGLYR